MTLTYKTTTAFIAALPKADKTKLDRAATEKSSTLAAEAEKALYSAEATLHGATTGRYALPLPTTNYAVLGYVQALGEGFLYNELLGPGANKRVEKNFEKTTETLEKISTGKLHVYLASQHRTADNSTNIEDPDSVGTDGDTGGKRRIFDRDDMGGF